MNAKIFKPEYAKDLSYNIESNMVNYKNENYDWSHDAPMDTEPLTLPDDLCERMCSCYNQDMFGNFIPDGNSFAKYDGKAAIVLFEALQDLRPKVVAQHHLWVSLAHMTLMTYMRKRWSKINQADFNDVKCIKEHWLNNDRIRNWLKGLYWQVKCTAIPVDENTWDYQYTDFLFSRQNLGNRGIAARPYLISNPKLVKGTLEFLKKYEKDFLSPHFEEKAERCFQILLQEGAKIEYGTWSEEDFVELLLSHKKELEVILDKKVAKKLREEQLNANGIDVAALKKKKAKSKNKKRKKHKKR